MTDVRRFFKIDIKDELEAAAMIFGLEAAAMIFELGMKFCIDEIFGIFLGDLFFMKLMCRIFFLFFLFVFMVDHHPSIQAGRQSG